MATYEAKYPKATDCLAKDRGVLLTFYDFPAEHTWIHLRTTNPIESTFAYRASGCVAPPHEGERQPPSVLDNGVQTDATGCETLAATERIENH